MINKVLQGHIREMKETRDRLNAKIDLIQERNQAEMEIQRQKQIELLNNMDKRSDSGSFSDDDMREKKRRRKRDEIDREYKCPVEGCDKAYG